MPIIISSEKVSDKFLVVNGCSEQHLYDKDYDTIRQNGRIDYGLQYVAEGKCYYEDDGIVKIAEKGTALLHFPGVRQHYSFKKEDKSILLWSHFTGTLCNIFDNIKSNITLPIEISNTKEFEHIFRSMISAQNIKEPYYETTVSGYMTVLLSLLIKNAIKEDTHISSKKHREIEKVINNMYVNMHNPLSLEEYANECCVSKSRFMHIFKEHTGVSPYHFQLKIRIEKAKELLNYTNISVSECAAEIGFNDISYFCRIFKKFTSYTPLQYRNGIR